MLDVSTGKFDFTEVSIPLIVKEKSMFGKKILLKTIKCMSLLVGWLVSWSIFPIKIHLSTTSFKLVATVSLVILWIQEDLMIM